MLITPNGLSLTSRPPSARVATNSSAPSQLHALRPDRVDVAMRGNLDTPLCNSIAAEGQALALAAAGVHRLGFTQLHHELFPFRSDVPGAGQGALGIETRTDDMRAREAVAATRPSGDSRCGQRRTRRVAPAGRRLPGADRRPRRNA